MIRPRPAFRMAGKTSWVILARPKTLTSNWRRAFGQVHFFQRAEGAVPGIVDQDVYPPAFLQNAADGGAHRIIVRHVQRQDMDSEGLQRLHPVHAAGPGIDQ